MRKKTSIFLILLVFAAFLVPSTGCAPKYGCAVYETTKPPTNRKGELSKKGGKSNLFPKHMRRHR